MSSALGARLAAPSETPILDASRGLSWTAHPMGVISSVHQWKPGTVAPHLVELELLAGQCFMVGAWQPTKRLAIGGSQELGIQRHFDSNIVVKKEKKQLGNQLEHIKNIPTGVLG